MLLNFVKNANKINGICKENIFAGLVQPKQLNITQSRHFLFVSCWAGGKTDSQNFSVLSVIILFYILIYYEYLSE